MKVIYLILMGTFGLVLNKSVCQGLIVVDEQINPGGLIDEIPLKPLESVGSFYLLDNWENGNIYLMNGKEIKNHPINYDLKYKMLEINTQWGIKVLGQEKVNGFRLLSNNEYYINVEEYDKSAGLVGFFRVLEEGEFSLLKFMESKVLPANYVPETDTGRRYDKIIKTASYFLARGEKINELSRKKKTDLKLFNEFEDELAVFAKEEKLSLKNESDLIKLVRFCNKNLQ